MSDKGRIARNTIMLYIRMAITLLVGLYTTRVVLRTLGVEDYGIYNVVGGVVTICSFISNALSTTSQRFFSYEIGRGNNGRLKLVFSASFAIYFVFCIIILFLAETIGLWFVINKLNFPNDRLCAVLIVYQFSVASFIFLILRIPYNSLIIAEEKMDFFAWISIIETLLKLVVVYMLLLVSYDKLIAYSSLMLLVTLIVTFIYIIYCRRRFYFCRLSLPKKKEEYLPFLNFTGWSMISNIASIVLDQGLNIILNIFCGPIVNTARAIGYSIKSSTAQFATNFQMASIPQIIKYYSSGEKNKMEELLYQSSKVSFYLLLLVSLPIIFNLHYILQLWLGSIPGYSYEFSVLALIITLVECLSGTIIPTIQATGNVKWYNIIIGSTFILALPIVYILLLLGYSPIVSMIIPICLGILCLIFRMMLLQYYVGISFVSYLMNVLCYDFVVCLASIFLSVVFITITPGDMTGTIIRIIGSLIIVAASVLCFGFTKRERKELTTLIINKIKNEKNG